ncbi:PKD domain-containing protein, partial [Aquimarina algiphila]
GSPEYQRCINERNLNNVSHSSSDNETFGLLLHKIITPSETVTFDYSTYTTVNINKNPTSLDAVTIKNSIGQEVMKYTLNYTDKTATRKLLTTISRGKTNTPQQEYYRFEYYGNPTSDIAYYKQDYWGYYSGNTNTTGSLISENSNRTSDFASTQEGALKKIHYPTQGYSEFIYEQNQVYGKLDTGEVGSEARLDMAINKTITSDTYPINDNINETIRVPFTPKALPDGSVKVSFGYYLHSSMGYSLSLVELKKIGGTIKNCPGAGICNYKFETASAELEPVTKQQDQTLYTLEPGDYELVLTLERIAAPSNPDRTPRAVASVTLKYYSGNPPSEPEVTNIPFGGIRIKEINSYDAQGGHTTKRYSYMKEDAVTSSGINLSKPVFVSKENYHYLPDRTPPGRTEMDCYLTKRTSSSNIPLSTYIGSPVLYTTVEEQLVGDAGEVLKTRSYFSGQTDLTERFPFPPTEKKNWRKGLTLQQQSYTKEGSSYTVNGKTTNVYGPLERHTGASGHLNSYNLKAGKVNYVFDAVGNLQTMTSGVNNSQFVTYVNRSELYPMFSSKQEEIHDNKTIIKNSAYTYDNPYGQLKTQTTTDSDNKTLTTAYSYPYDKNSTVNNLLVAQNRITTPVETQSKENTTILGTQVTEFIDWGNGIVLPGITKVAKGGDTPEPRLTYHKYDTQGNPLEVSQVDGRHIMYVWGYNNTQPIVKIDNASYTGIPAAVMTLIDQLKTTSDTEDTAVEETTMRTLFKNLREHAYFANAQISGYTYDPLIGVTSMTSPQGQTAYYRYDDMNRMQYALDQNQHVVQQVRYNYQGQQSDALGGVIIDTPGDQPKVPNQPATFMANTSGTDGANLYTWTVNGVEEQCDTSPNFTTTFTGEGTYEVKVLAYNTHTKHRVSHTMSVEAAYPPLGIPTVSGSQYILKGTNASLTASGISGGTGNSSYEWYVNNVKQSSTTTSLTYTSNTAGTYDVYFKVIDNESGNMVNSTVRKLYIYNPLNTPSISASKTDIDRGTTTTFTASGISGGSGYHRYEWYRNGVKQSETGTSYSYHFPSKGTYDVYFRVVDTRIAPEHYKNSNTRRLHVYDPLTISVSPGTSTLTNANPSVNISLSRSKGSGHYSQSWRVWRLTNPSTNYYAGSGTSLPFGSSQNGEYEIKVTVTDTKTGTVKEKIVPIIVNKSSGGGGGGTGEQF